MSFLTCGNVNSTTIDEIIEIKIINKYKNFGSILWNKGAIKLPIVTAVEINIARNPVALPFASTTDITVFTNVGAIKLTWNKVIHINSINVYILKYNNNTEPRIAELTIKI